MNIAECLRILGVPADATTEQIRQAYLDLVRVWHPDRFQSDSRLRQIAGERLQEINEAYSELRNYRPSPAAEPEPARESPRPREAPPQPPPASPPFPTFVRRSSFRRPLQGKLASAAMISVLCLAPFLATLQLVKLLRAPIVDANLLAERALKPGILAPMRIIDPLSDVRVAADTITEWARGDAIDLWRPVGRSNSAKSGGSLEKSPDLRKSQTRRPDTGVTEASLAGGGSRLTSLPSGTELIRTGHSSAPGYLRLANRTDLEAIVKVVGNHSTLRAIYIAPNKSATIRSLRMGVYDIHVELGNDLDAEHLRFRRNRYTPDPLGPFEFLEITSENGRAGTHFDIELAPR